jgi:hypothetical protein
MLAATLIALVALIAAARSDASSAGYAVHGPAPIVGVPR